MSARDSAPQVRIASPCHVEWDSMIGNDRMRFCEHCQLTVHNVDRASRKQIKRLVVRSKGRLCVNYRQPVPQKLPTPILYKIGRRTSVIAASAFSATLSISSAVAGATLKQTSLPHEVAFSTRVNEYVSASGSGKLYGFVFDPNGAVITGASVTLTNAETGDLSYSYTNGSGEYRFEGITPGTYHLKINPQKGFSASDVPNIVIRADDNNRIDQTLSIAPVEAEVTVEAEKPVSLGGAMVIVLASDPLVKAVMDDDLQAVQLALLNTANANARDKATRHSALERAISNGNREILQVLLWAKADVNSRDSDGQTPLMMIGEDTTSEMIWDLINAGAKVNLRDHEGDTALISAAEVDNVEALKALLDAGAKVNETNNDGETALIAAAQMNLVHNVRALILAGANVNARDKMGRTALMHAIDDDHKAIVRLLKAHGAIEFEAPEKQE